MNQERLCSKSVGLKQSVMLLAAALSLTLITPTPAQTFTTLHSFTALHNSTNSDGAHADAGLILSGNTLYGSMGSGGSWGNGTVFKVNTDGTGFTNLHIFTAFSFGTNADGGEPPARLLLSDDTLYGTALGGGTGGPGTVFKLNTDGSDFTTLHNFTCCGTDDGENPAGLILWGNTLYGTTVNGGSSDNGTVFAIKTDGSSFTSLYSFTTTDSSGVNSDGRFPMGELILSGSMLYGTAIVGGDSGSGTVFALATDGSTFTTLYSFGQTVNNSHNYFTNSDGANPSAGLILSSNTLYGTTYQGGSWGVGSVFALETDGTGFRNLHIFSASSDNGLGATNSDGALPSCVLVLSGNTLYGTTLSGGSAGAGTVFSLNTDGTGFTVLHSFTAQDFGTNSDGTTPNAGLVLSGQTLYGTASYGGSEGSGTVFSLSFRPQMSITPFSTSVVLSWPTNYAGFDYTGYTLQSATNLVSPVWTTISSATVVINGQNTVTNPISGTKQFYRLSQ